MNAAGVRRVGVAGCGTMGAGIAEVCARAGLDVLVAASTTDSAARGRRRLDRSLAGAVRKGRLGERDAEAVLARIAFTTNLPDLADRDLVVESIAEDEGAKRTLFTELDKIVAAPAILATNTSSIPIARIARAATAPGRVVGLHFFNPVPVLPLVEITAALLTDESTVERAGTFVAEVLGKQPIRTPDRAGFVVNALLIPYLLSAIRMVEPGAVPAATVDDAMTLGCAHPMGPLRLADLIGLDVVLSIAEALQAEFGEQQYVPPSLLRRLVEAGALGRKSGRGFHSYP